MTDRTSGKYWRVMWSSDWRSKTPWTLRGKPTPYIGIMEDPHIANVVVLTIGPIAILSVYLAWKEGDECGD